MQRTCSEHVRRTTSLPAEQWVRYSSRWKVCALPKLTPVPISPAYNPSGVAAVGRSRQGLRPGPPPGKRRR